MASRRRTPQDMQAVKKSRSSYTGAVTKAFDKLTGMPIDTQDDVLRLKPKEVDRLLLSLERTEKGFHQSMEDALEFLPTDEEEELVFQESEDAAKEAFCSSLSTVRDMADQILALKSVLNGLSCLKTDLEALQESLEEKPEANQAEAMQSLNTLYSKLRQEWQAANLEERHPLKAELDSCSKTLTCLKADVATARSKGDAHSTSTSSTHSTDTTLSTGCCSSKSDLPVIEVPKFHGNIMAWSTFWASFDSTIGNRKDLDDTKRLHYLRMAIKDEDAKKLLYSPTETPGFYQEVVTELKRRYDRTTEVHRELTRSILNLSTPKQTRLDLRRLTDQVRRLIGSFKATGFYTIESFLCSVVYLLIPIKLQTLWDQHTRRTKGVPTIDRLLEFLQDHAEALPATTLSTPHQGESENPTKKPYRSNQATRGNKSHVNAAAAPPAAAGGAPAASTQSNPQGSTQTHNYKWDCFLCLTEKHPLFVCPKWATLSVVQRLGHVKNRNLCSNCLSMGHTIGNCKSTYRCRPCGQKHHSTLHQDPSTPTVNSTSAARRQMPDALMTTAQVLLTGPRGQEVKARALIDSGAGLSLITHGMAQKLGLPLTPSKLTLFGVQGVKGKPAKYSTELDIAPVIGSTSKKIHCSPVVVKTVTGNLPGEPVDSVHHLDHMIGLQLADETYNVTGKIDILLGADLAPQIMVKQVLRSGADSEPMAQATLFGWVISGPATSSLNSTSHTAYNTQLQSDDHPLTEVVQEFWATEEVPGDDELSLSAQEQQAEDHYEHNTTYSDSLCRYTVSLPRVTELFPLGESRVQARGRYISSEAHNRRRGITEVFQTEVKKYLELGHAEKVPLNEDPPDCVFYLPMHAVFKDSSTSTKLRVVFDGSATTTSGRSLNQALLVGPTLQPTLTEILLKFRTYRIAMNADISKMYREVLLEPADRDLHRFLWREIPSGPLEEYRMCRVTFGVSASPFLAVRTLQKTASDHGGDYPEASAHIFNSFYVDDFLGGASSTEEAMQLFEDIRSILKKGGFNLVKWRSSSKAVLQEIPVELQEATTTKDSTSDTAPTISKALGLVWDAERDEMSPAINVSPTYTSTKRGLFRDVSKTYDVLGWIAPTVVVMKILFQSLWKTGQEWDDEVPADLASQHSKWRTELPLLKQRTLPRCYHLTDRIPLSKELHAFCDASLRAYGAVVYCRTTYRDHAPVITLVTAKTKVAKISPSTVPRLELCGAVLLVKLLIATASTLNIPSSEWHAWTDSSIVLAWLDGQPRQFKQYVANRVSFVLQATQPQHWKHVPTGENPADCCSRGLMPAELLSYDLWWNGPLWLHQDPYSEPHQPPRRTVQPLEMKTVKTVNLVNSQPSVLCQMQERTSGYYMTLAVTAWWFRFRDRLKFGRPQPDNRILHLSGHELQRAKDWILKENQLINFPKEVKALLKGQTIPPTSRLRALNPQLDSVQFLRVGGRLGNSVLTLSQQHPVIADSHDSIIKKWFQHIHLSLCHCGPTLLLSYAGNHLHILGARRLSRTVCSQCTVCRRNAPTWTTQMMGDLPSERVTPALTFLHTGMDLAGPFYLKLGYVRKPTIIEAHICIFVCLTYKAVHLEVLSDQKTDTLLACIARFVSRRSCPQHLYSDNGPNFTGAKNELKRLYSWLRSEPVTEEIQHYLQQHHGITWHNTPPASPHFGGLWESAVRSMKKHLRRIMGTNRYTFEQLTTIACQVEACLNSRPLLPITSHNQDGLVTLTASHFLLYHAPSFYPEDPRLPERPDLLKKWRHCQAVVQHFWQRWSWEYLATLQARSKWQQQNPNLQIGDIILLKYKKTISCHWPLARITAVYPGQGGLVRVATVKTASGSYKRSVVKLALIFRPAGDQEPAQSLPPGGCLGSTTDEEITATST